MPKYIVDGSDLTSVANTIRTKGGTSGSLSFPNGWNSAINAIGGGGGGGGSSDYSNAQVSISYSSAGGWGKTPPSIALGDFVRVSNNSIISYSESIGTGTTRTYDLIVYKNHAYPFVELLGAGVLNATITGNASVVDSENDYISFDITGDCTIAITVAPST